MAGAQMAAQGSQMIGQGLANLGEEVGKGVAAYYKKKEIKKLEDDGVAFVQKLGTTSPYLLKAVGISDVNDVGAIKAGIKASGGAANFLTMARTIKGELEQREATVLGNLYTRAGNTNLSPIDKQFNPIEYSPESQRMAQNQFMADTTTRLQQDKLRSGIELDRANAGAKSLGGRIMTQKEFNDIDTKKYDVKARPLADGTYLVESISPFGPGSQNVINLGDNSFSKALGTELAPRQIKEYDNAVDAQIRLQKLYELRNLVETGDVTTGLGADFFNSLNQARAQFLNDIKANKTVTNTQILDTLLGAGVFGAISEQKLGSKNFDTPVEMKNIRAAFVGDKGFTNDSIKAITDYRIKAEITAGEKFAANEKAGVYDNFYKESKFVKPDFSFLPPKGVSFDVWQNMTPERRANWNSK